MHFKHQFPSDANDAGSGPHFENHILRICGVLSRDAINSSYNKQASISNNTVKIWIRWLQNFITHLFILSAMLNDDDLLNPLCPTGRA